jgi:hypothetical protein
MALDFLQHSPRLLSALNSMVQQQVAMMTQSDQLAAQNATLIQQNATMVERIAALEQIVIGRRPSGQGDWICPVCGHHYTTLASFKGHVRRLIYPAAQRTKCFLDPNNPDHQALVSHARYGEGNFDSRSKNYALMLYETIRSNSTSTKSSEDSFSAVSSSLHVCIFSILCRFKIGLLPDHLLDLLLMIPRRMNRIDMNHGTLMKNCDPEHYVA